MANGLPIAVLGDKVYCPDGICRRQNDHPPGPYNANGIGYISTAAKNTMAGGRFVARLGDRALAGGPTTLSSASTKVLVEGAFVHRVTDRNTCGGNTTGPGIAKVLIG